MNTSNSMSISTGSGIRVSISVSVYYFIYGPWSMQNSALCICICICICICLCMYMYMYIRIHIYIYVYTWGGPLTKQHDRSCCFVVIVFCSVACRHPRVNRKTACPVGTGLPRGNHLSGSPRVGKHTHTHTEH